MAIRKHFAPLVLSFYAYFLLTMLPCTATAVDGLVDAPSSFTYAGGEVPKWVAAGEQPDNGSYSVTWTYPVFLGKDQLRLRKLNGWLRTVSLTALFQGDLDLSRRALAMKDSRVLTALSHDIGVRGAAGTQSELVPSRVFGPYILFTLNSEWLGGSRPQHAIETFVFDYRAGASIPIESLFKSGAQEEIASLLEAAISKTFKDDKRSYTNCRKQQSHDSKLACERQLNDDDIDACLNWRSFDWHLLSIEGPQRLSLTFPYNPAWHQTCGDEYYVLEGKTVEKLFVTPAIFRNSRVPKELEQ